MTERRTTNLDTPEGYLASLNISVSGISNEKKIHDLFTWVSQFRRHQEEIRRRGKELADGCRKRLASDQRQLGEYQKSLPSYKNRKDLESYEAQLQTKIDYHHEHIGFVRKELQDAIDYELRVLQSELKSEEASVQWYEECLRNATPGPSRSVLDEGDTNPDNAKVERYAEAINDLNVTKIKRDCIAACIKNLEKEIK